MCARACLSEVPSPGVALKLASASRPRVSAWSISPWTQVSGPRSKSGVVSMAMRLAELATPEALSKKCAAGVRYSLYLEPRNGAAQLRGELRQLADRHVRLLRTLSRLFGDLENALHPARHIRDRRRLFLRLRGDASDQLGELARHAPDFVERLPRSVRQFRSFHHANRALLHGCHGVLRVGLNGFHDGV